MDFDAVLDEIDARHKEAREMERQEQEAERRERIAAEEARRIKLNEARAVAKRCFDLHIDPIVKKLQGRLGGIKDSGSDEENCFSAALKFGPEALTFSVRFGEQSIGIYVRADCANGNHSSMWSSQLAGFNENEAQKWAEVNAASAYAHFRERSRAVRNQPPTIRFG